LQRRFEESFWCEDLGTYAFGLDPDKRPIRTVASNPGHLLWSGIVRPDRAARVAARLLEDDMWSGWGIRTLSTHNPAYNPYLYQHGAVWPHDNGLIALGCKRYGLTNEAAQIARGIFDAAGTFKGYRLPELFSGLPRERLSFPVQYKQANIPQAWAAGSVFHFIQAILGLRADAPAGRLYVAPTLPDWLEDVTLENLEVGRAVVALRFFRRGDRSGWDVVSRKGDLDIVEVPWMPSGDTRDPAANRKAG
jgi:glycogen debranching enzyme